MCPHQNQDLRDSLELFVLAMSGSLECCDRLTILRDLCSVPGRRHPGQQHRSDRLPVYTLLFKTTLYNCEDGRNLLTGNLRDV